MASPSFLSLAVAVALSALLCPPPALADDEDIEFHCQVDEGNGELLTWSDVSEVKEALLDLIAEKPDRAGTYLRLSFHDCATGCNGCLNLNNANNNNLNVSLIELSGLKKKLDEKLTGTLHFGDLLYLAGAVAVEEGVRVQNEASEDCRELGLGCILEPDIVFKQGRKFTPADPDDDKDSAAGRGMLPGPNMVNQNLLRYFNNTFGFGSEQTVALLGAHTLGRCHIEGVGFKGDFTKTPHAFNSEYFLHVERAADGKDEYEPEEGRNIPHTNRKKHAWRDKPEGLILLSTDVSLAKILHLKMLNETPAGESPGEPEEEDLHTLDAANTARMVARFAMDDGFFVGRFVEAYIKMGDKAPVRDEKWRGELVYVREEEKTPPPPVTPDTTAKTTPEEEDGDDDATTVALDTTTTGAATVDEVGTTTMNDSTTELADTTLSSTTARPYGNGEKGHGGTNVNWPPNMAWPHGSGGALYTFNSRRLRSGPPTPPPPARTTSTEGTYHGFLFRRSGRNGGDKP